MMYIPRASLVTAQPLEMAGASLVVVQIPGGYEVVAADAFNRLFRPAESADRPQAETEPLKEIPEKASIPHPWSKNGKAQLNLQTEKPAKRMESREPSKLVGIVKQTAAVVSGENASELRTTEAMLQAVGEAPRTSAETQDRVCVLMGWPTTEKKFRDRVYQAIWTAINAKKIEKRTDPATQLPHLYLVGAK